MSLKDNLVVVEQGGDGYRMTINGLIKLNLTGLKGSKVLVKPNCGRPFPPGSGVVTAPSVVAGVVDYLRDLGAKVTIGESCIMGVNAKEAFQKSGIAEVANERKIPLLDLDEGGGEVISIEGGTVLSQVRVSSKLKEYDFVVTVPVMKTHMHTVVSLGLKNMKGVLWRREKVRFHQLKAPHSVTRGYKELDLAIADLSKAIMPGLSVIDGTIGMEGLGPSAGMPKKVGMVICSINPIAADLIAAYLMGFDPPKIPHLRLIAEGHGLSADLQQFRVNPLRYEELRKTFVPPPEKISFTFPGVRVMERQACSACLSTVLVFLKRHYDQLKSKPLCIFVGRGVKDFARDLSEGALCIGNCALEGTQGGIRISGCPPVASQIWEALMKETA
ncbi:MAG: hypothetical protein DRG83_08950 [Deltaproteobacteria bacterium]|nr:MAG: hypothetical protein DRG83_08950 [Deltaproteobacteria bacterium]